MAKPRKVKNIKRDLSDSLDYEGLVVVGGDENTLYVRSTDTTVPLCDRCLQKERLGIKPKYDCRMKNHDLFEKQFFDIIRKDDGSFKVVTLIYQFYKYRCLDENCATVYQKPISFAREGAHVTRRFEDYLVGLACHMSYSEISKRLKHTVSKQAVADIIKRWTETRDVERGAIHTPELLGLMKFVADGKDYVIAFDAADPDLRVLDVFPGLQGIVIEAFLRTLNLNELKGVITDCEPVVIQAAENALFNIDIMVSIDAILQQAITDFADLIHEDAMHIENHKKDILKKNPEEAASHDYDTEVIRTVTEKYPRVNMGYTHLNMLRGILSRDWDAIDIREWNDNTPDDIKDFFLTSSLYVKEYWEKMLRYYMRRNEVSGDLYKRLLKLNDRINCFKMYSEDLFKSRLLYIPEDYNEAVRQDDQWYGVPYENIIAALKDMQAKKEDAINERVWKRY